MDDPRPVRRTQAERRAETKRRVLDAATLLVAKHGSRSVSLAAVGEAAGYSRGIVNHHFGTRAQLLKALIEYTQQFEVPGDAVRGLDRVTDFVGAYLGGMHRRSPRSEAFLKLWAESAGAESSLAPLFAERDGAFRQLLESYIRGGLADGSIRSDVNSVTASVALIGLLRGTAMLMFTTASDVSAANLSKDVSRGVAISLARQK